MQIISKNSKTGYSVNFPIEQTCDKSCPFYQNKTCYGLKGRFLFKGVREANEARFNLYREFPAVYWVYLHKDLAKLAKKGVTHIRINGIGDTPDLRWVKQFLEVAWLFPAMQFWVATRKAFWQGLKLPDNLTVRFSDGIDDLLTSNVTNKIVEATCPATTGEVSDCKACGYKCWAKNVQHVSYMKH